jgi:hypothetical protein
MLLPPSLEFLRLPGFTLHDLGKIRAEAGREHFRQDDE